MKKLDAWLARADDGLRTLLLGRGLPGWLLGICTFAAFFLLMMTRTLTQLAGVQTGARAWAVLVLLELLDAILQKKDGEALRA